MSNLHAWLEIGNSNVKWIIADPKQLSRLNIDQQVAVNPLPQKALEATQLKSIWSALVGLKEASIFVSFTPTNQPAKRFVDYLQQQLDASCRWYCLNQWQPNWPLKINYSKPAEYGIDRYLSCYACLDQRSAVVIDWGTAITLDAWQPNFDHQGGWIMASIDLYQSAFKPIHLNPKRSYQVTLANTTRDAIGNGYAVIIKSWLQAMTQQPQQLFGFVPQRFIISGNGWQPYRSWLTKDWSCCNHLALRGLVKLSQQVLVHQAYN